MQRLLIAIALALLVPACATTNDNNDKAALIERMASAKTIRTVMDAEGQTTGREVPTDSKLNEMWNKAEYYGTSKMNDGVWQWFDGVRNYYACSRREVGSNGNDLARKLAWIVKTMIEERLRHCKGPFLSLGMLGFSRFDSSEPADLRLCVWKPEGPYANCDEK